MTSDTPGAHGDETAPDRLQLRGRARWPLRVIVTGLVVAAVVVGYVTSRPAALPTSDEVVTASTPVGQSVYLGVFQVGTDLDHVSGVKVFATSTVPVEITTHVCDGGSVGVTTQPEMFCSAFVDTEDVVLNPGDEIVLEVTGDEAGVVAIDRVRLGYRDGLHWATHSAGSPAVVTILSR
jgi:hypothetical protein